VSLKYTEFFSGLRAHQTIKINLQLAIHHPSDTQTILHSVYRVPLGLYLYTVADNN